MEPSRSERVAIVGAGITGLATSYYLHEADVDHVVFEATDRAGGVIRTEHDDGRVLECGPQRGRLTPSLREMVATLDLEDELVTVDDDLPLYIYFDGALREVPFDVATFLRTDLLSLRGKARLLFEPFTGAGREDETAAALLTRKFGREAYENLIGPLFGGTYGSDPAEMIAGYSMTRLLALEDRAGSLLKPALKYVRSSGGGSPAFSFEDGLERLPGALADHLDDHVEFRTTVEGIQENRDGYVVETGDETVAVDHVVLTTPADVTARLLGAVAPAAADALASLRYNPMALVHVVSDADAHGLGYQIRRDEPYDTLGVTWNESLFDREDLYTCFLGGMYDPDLVDEPDDALADIATREFEAVMGHDATAVNVARTRFPAYDRSWRALDDESLPDGIVHAANVVDGAGIPSRLRKAKSVADSLLP